MKKDILIYKDNKDILTQVSEPIDWDSEECTQLIEDLKDTLDAASTGVGLSAIQIGVPKRVCYIKYNNQKFIMINPVIIWKRNDLKLYKEGCLSAPKSYKMIPRSSKVICQYTDENGETKYLDDGGWLSVIVQHELDHFEGRCQVCED